MTLVTQSLKKAAHKVHVPVTVSDKEDTTKTSCVHEKYLEDLNTVVFLCHHCYRAKLALVIISIEYSFLLFHKPKFKEKKKTEQYGLFDITYRPSGDIPKIILLKENIVPAVEWIF